MGLEGVALWPSFNKLSGKKHWNGSWVCCWESRDIKSAPWPRIGHFVKHAMTCSHDWFAPSPCLQKFNWLKDRSRMTPHSEWISSNESCSSEKRILIPQTKLILAKKTLFYLMAWIIDKIVFRNQNIRECLLRNKCIHKVSPFGAEFWLKAPSSHSSSEMQLIRQEQLMMLANTT